MAEWLNAAVLKTARSETASRVRIPLPPQKETSRSERAEVVRATGTDEAESGRKHCRCATNWQGEEKEKHAVLSRTVGFVPTFLT